MPTTTIPPCSIIDECFWEGCGTSCVIVFTVIGLAMLGLLMVISATRRRTEEAHWRRRRIEEERRRNDPDMAWPPDVRGEDDST
jgi:hypothetical protein